MRKRIGLLGVVGMVSVAGVMVVRASVAVGVTPTLLARGSYQPFHLKTDPQSPIDFMAKTKTDVDIVVRQHDYLPGSYTGWHAHPGPVFVTVVKGTLTFYEADDPTCSPTVVTEGHGYVDTGHGHIGRNETSAPAQDISVILAPVGMPFRTELSAPGNCPF